MSGVLYRASMSIARDFSNTSEFTDVFYWVWVQFRGDELVSQGTYHTTPTKAYKYMQVAASRGQVGDVFRLAQLRQTGVLDFGRWKTPQ